MSVTQICLNLFTVLEWGTSVTLVLCLSIVPKMVQQGKGLSDSEPQLTLCLLEELETGPEAKAGVFEALSDFTEVGGSLCHWFSMPAPPFTHFLPLELSAHFFLALASVHTSMAG